MKRETTDVKRETIPVVTIVGRPNVGKSALFNRLVKKRMAIVHDQAGVTRDRLVAECSLGSVRFLVVDTGGIGVATGETIDQQVHHETDLGVSMADLILFVVDGRDGLTPLDEEVGRQLRRTKKPVIAVVNKIDHDNVDSSEFTQLGFGKLVLVSAAHGLGIDRLLAEIAGLLPPAPGPELPTFDSAIRLAIVGRPNVGKSSLINAILQDRRTIVSDVPGTTRDAVDIPYERSGRRFVLVDTAGIRARGKHNTSVEVFSVMRSEKSIERADLCLLVIDATQGVTAQDKKIARLIGENRKPCLIVANKLDLVKPESASAGFMESIIEQIRAGLFALDYAPVTVLSAKTGEALGRLFRSFRQIEEQAKRTIGTGRLNRILRTAQESQPPPAHGGKRLKILYATQLNNDPTRSLAPPVFLLFVNQAQLLTPVYQRYLEKAIRREIEYQGLPLVFRLRGRSVRAGNG